MGRRYAIVGFGCAGYHALEALRQSDSQAEIHVWSELDEPPANPMLTTYYAAGRLPYEALFPFGTLDDITRQFAPVLHTGAAVTALDAANRTLTDASGTVHSYDAILPGSDEITTVWTENLTHDARGTSYQLRAHNLYEATYDADGNITKMEFKEDNNAYNTDTYENDGYGMLTVTANTAQEFIESGTRTLRFPDAEDNNRYILLAPDCLFFVNGMDDENGDYELYGSMSAALTALGTNADGEHLSHLQVLPSQPAEILDDQGLHLTVLDHLHDFLPRGPVEVGPGVSVVRQEQGVLKSIVCRVLLQKQLLVVDGVGLPLPLVLLTEPAIEDIIFLACHIL